MTCWKDANDGQALATLTEGAEDKTAGEDEAAGDGEVEDEGEEPEAAVAFAATSFGPDGKGARKELCSLLSPQLKAVADTSTAAKAEYKLFGKLCCKLSPPKARTGSQIPPYGP